MRFVLTVGKSRIVQTIRLEAGSKLLSFETEVAWNESRRLLRTSFPLNSVAVDAVCEIACGHLRRPTHSNTEWDFAKFEVCAHRWIDIGDARYGVALLNDCKYGHSVRDNVLGLSLLRSPLYPDPDADQGNHRFTYALLPHEGSLEASDVIERAAALNRVPVGFPDRAVMIAAEACRRVDREDGIPTPSDRSHDQWDRLFLPFRVTGSGLSLEALKKAEKEEAWIVRVSENRGLGTEGTISGPWTDATICETDMLEWNDGEVRAFDSEHRFRLLPFEIRTFKIRPALPSQV